MDKKEMNKLQTGDEQFISDLNAAVMHRNRKLPYFILTAMGSFVVFLILWAHFSEIEIITRGMGKAVPSKEIQVIQNLEGGIISKMNAKEGQSVKEGDLLVKLDNSKYLSAFKEMEADHRSIKCNLTRLYAEYSKSPKVSFSEELQVDKRLCATQGNLFKSRNNQYASLKSGYNVKIKHLKVEILEQHLSLVRLRAEMNQVEADFSVIETANKEMIALEQRLFTTRKKIYQAQKTSLTSNQNILRKEWQQTKDLEKDGAASMVEVLRLERQVMDIEGSLQSLESNRLGDITRSIESRKQSKVKLEGLLVDSESALNQFDANWFNEIITSIADYEGKLNAVREKISSLDDTVKRTRITSPVDGVINEVFQRNEGGVVSPGQPILEIIPDDDKLVVEGMVSPQEVAFLRMGMHVIVKISAYDYSVYGGLDGTLTHISADTHTDEATGAPFYKVLVETDQNFLMNENNKVIPGMTAQLDILTGKRSVLNYFISPIYNAQSTVFTER
ncbi:HlyD family type I secretion periplasmic adaptor subunit [Lentisphaera profundi]|uniref:HlyD family type I secretion periplasmic adaptor subunit n=1 Tax=Lentisphaera profundi TaxID=1658616 RepID=A0ABY7W0Q8_9BACT|nr:HlyD family type I secretion periplasmic adaptor subunit [Lentisphaera profundi]WDE99134.1 HlyD family type I secretion periplasmic adaptor subunit [Lentisphaera profundi]